MTLTRPVFVFSTHKNAFKLKLNQKSFFHYSFPPKCGVLQFKFYWKFHWKHALLFHLFLFQKPEAFFHANRRHEPSYLLIHFDALLIIWNSAVACSFTLLTCTSQSDKKSFMKRHDHQPPFFRRKILLFTISYLVFLRKRRRWAFLNTLQALDPPTFRIFRFNFGYGNDFQQQFLLKNSEISTLFGSSPVLRHNNACVRDVLTAPSNVYLNLGLNLFHSYF